MVDTRTAYLALVAVFGVERGIEVLVSRWNAARTLARGGVESGRRIHLLVVWLHVVWLAACPAEVLFLGRPLSPVVLVWVLMTILVVAMALRIWSMRCLGDHWNHRIITVPGEAPICSGPYRWLHHPNYLALYLELFALPLLHGAWLTASLLAPVHTVAVWCKSRVENSAIGRIETRRKETDRDHDGP
jgi:methyltransferase